MEIGYFGVADFLLGGAVTEISNNSDLNTLTNIGLYRASSNTIASRLTNCPTIKAFVMRVEPGWKDNLPTQTIIDYTIVMYTRTQSPSSWTAWKLISGESVL